jgi:methyl-accepting chemotaxis protein
MNKQQGLLQTAKRSIIYSLLLAWGVGAFCLVSIFSFDDASEQAILSSQIIKKVFTAQNLILELESSQRGFLYTAREDYLVNLTKKAELISQTLVEAQELSGRPEQKNRIALLSRTANEKVDELKNTVQLAQNNQGVEAREIVLSDVGKRLMEEISDKTQTIIELESSYVDESWARVNRAIIALKAVVITGIVAIGLFNFFWYAEVRRRLEPLAACVKRAKAITMNQIPRDLLPVEKEDEVGSLTQSINEMTQALARSAGEVDEARVKVASLATSLAKRAVEQTAAISQLSAAIQEIAATIKDMNLSATQMSEKASDSVDEAKSREKAGVDGLDAVDRSLQATQSVTRQVDQVASITLELNHKAARIERIVFFVNELTERSNILSINAALLASNSDGNRDSFSVLADEMQKLTSRSKSATLEIHETLQDIRGEIQRVVLATEETSKQVEFGNDAATQASDSIKVLKQAVDHGNDTFLQVVAAVRQQNHALAQVEQALAAMRESAELVEEESHRLRTDASRLSELNQTLESSELLKAVRS